MTNWIERVQLDFGAQLRFIDAVKQEKDSTYFPSQLFLFLVFLLHRFQFDMYDMGHEIPVHNLIRTLCDCCCVSSSHQKNKGLTRIIHERKRKGKWGYRNILGYLPPRHIYMWVNAVRGGSMNSALFRSLIDQRWVSLVVGNLLYFLWVIFILEWERRTWFSPIICVTTSVMD